MVHTKICTQNQYFSIYPEPLTTQTTLATLTSEVFYAVEWTMGVFYP